LARLDHILPSFALGLGGGTEIVNSSTLLTLLATLFYSGLVLTIVAAAIVASLQGTSSPFSVGYAIVGLALFAFVLASPVELSFFAPIEVSSFVANHFFPVTDGTSAEHDGKNAAVYSLVLSSHVGLIAAAGGAFAATGQRRQWFR